MKVSSYPFFLRSWRHEHRLEQQKDHTVLIDAIEYHAPIRLLEWILWPILWWQFRYRQPVYRRYFNKRVDELTADCFVWFC